MAKKKETVLVEFTKAPAHLKLAYHKGQKAELDPETAKELIETGYAVQPEKAKK